MISPHCLPSALRSGNDLYAALPRSAVVYLIVALVPRPVCDLPDRLCTYSSTVIEPVMASPTNHGGGMKRFSGVLDIVGAVLAGFCLVSGLVLVSGGWP